MARGAQKPTRFFSGAVVLQPAAAIDAFVRMAPARSEFVFAEAPEEPRTAECWHAAGDLARQGLVRTHQRRRPGGGWQFFVVRSTKPLPKQLSPQDKLLGDRAAAAMLIALKRAANFTLVCPSDAELARTCGLNTRDQAKWRMRELTRVGLIRSELLYDGGVPYRVVTILDGRHAGSAGGKSTALPKKYAALLAAAERDAIAAGGDA